MTTILVGFAIFLKILFYIVFLDVILSWLTLFGLKVRPRFIADIIDPLYKRIKSIVPTTFGPIDFTPIFIIILIAFFQGVIININPDIIYQIPNFLR